MRLDWHKIFTFRFIWEILLFASCLVLAIDITIRLSLQVTEQAISVPSQISAWQFLLMFVIATVIILLVIKYIKNTWFLRIMFYIAIAQGLLVFSQAYLLSPYYFLLALVLFVSWLVINNVLVHDLILIIALSSIAVIFGTSLTPNTAIFILLFLAIYDYWAVYRSKHMVKMFNGLAKNNVHFALIIPDKMNNLFIKTTNVKPGTDFMFLGTGDLALPAIFVVSTLQQSLISSFCVALGATGGLIILYIIFISQAEKKPMPGLPPIVMGAMIGYFISLII